MFAQPMWLFGLKSTTALHRAAPSEHELEAVNKVHFRRFEPRRETRRGIN
jgi:hypothetical protein